RAALVADRVISSQQGLKYAFVVKPDNTVERRNLETGALFEGKRIVKTGLKDGEKVVSTRLQLLQVGMKVTPIPEEAAAGGADTKVVSESGATPIEQQVNGVENMLYMSSQSTSDGNMTLSITFKLGTNLDTAQVLVQNRVAIAIPVLPPDVQRIGVTTKKQSPDITMVVHLVSPDGSFDQLFTSNYALLQIRDELARLDGVGDINVFGAREYSMRIWLDPHQLSAR